MQGISTFLDQVRSGKVEPYFFVSHASADNAQIRPVLEHLLEAGIPLWFDRPRDAGFDPEQFVGSLSPNERWTTQLNEALAQARGLIWFPSANYSASDECKRELACADMLQGIMSEFEVAGICVSTETFSELGLREITRQATRAFVLKQDGAYALDVAFHPELEELTRILQSKLADRMQGRNVMVDQAKRFDGAMPGAASLGSERVRDYTVPFRVNRTTQRYSVKEIHDDYLSGLTLKRPLLICHGEDEDVSRQFVSTTLAERLVAENERLFEWSEQTAQPIRPNLPPYSASDKDRFPRRFRDNLFEKFIGAGTDMARGSVTEALAESFANDRCTRIVSSRLDLRGKDRGLSKLQDVLDRIQAWANFWEGFPFALADKDGFLSLIPVLEVIYEEGAEKGGFFRRAPISTQLEKFTADARKVADFNHTFEQVEIKFLERFDKITPRWVDEWIDDDLKLFSHLNDHKKRSLRDELETKLNGQNDLPMKSWSEESATVLEAWGIGIEGK